MIISIDPSIINLGIAKFEDGKLIDATCIHNPDGYTKNKKKIKYTEVERLDNLITSIFTFISDYSVMDNLVIEIPNYQYNDTNKKSMFLLHKTIGFIEGSFCSGEKHEVGVREWKSNKSKEATEYEINLIYPSIKELIKNVPDGQKNNVYDAVGIGHYFISKQKMEGKL